MNTDFQAKWCEAIVASSEDAIISKTLAGIVSSWNAKAESLFGFSADEMIGQSILVLFPDDRKAEELEIIRQVARGEIVHNFETVRLHKAGRQIEVSITVSPIRDELGNIVGVSKIVRDISERKRAEREIARLSVERLKLLNTRTNELRETEGELENRTAELDSTLRKLASVERRKIEEERKRLSQDLHDEIGQMLTALSFNLEMIRRKTSVPEVSAFIDTAIGITGGVVDAVRGIIHQLRPPQLDEFGLIAALRWHIDKLRRSTLLDIALHESLGSRRLPAELEMTCFRIIQESLTNIVRHASASHSDIQIDLQPTYIYLRIADNGVGFDTSPSSGDDNQVGHYGLRGMRERVLSWDGHFAVGSSMGNGCAIEATLPRGDSPGKLT